MRKNYDQPLPGASDLHLKFAIACHGDELRTASASSRPADPLAQHDEA